MRIQINSHHFAEMDDIVRLVEKKSPKCATCRKTWVYLEKGYPKILKAAGSKMEFLRKLLRNGLTKERYEELRDKK